MDISIFDWAKANLSERAVAITHSLEWLFDKVAPGESKFAHFTSRIEVDQSIDNWIMLASASAGASGFVTSLGGILTLPLAIPANLASVATIQLSLIARIAASRGYAVTSPEVRSVALACLTGNAATELLKEAGVKLGNKLGEKAVAQVAGATLFQINKAVGFRLVTKAGEQGIVNLSKIVPIVGGIVGGSIDAVSTQTVGKIAKAVFPWSSSSSPDVTSPEADHPSQPQLLA